jgi:hypothetical protein
MTFVFMMVRVYPADTDENVRFIIIRYVKLIREQF